MYTLYILMGNINALQTNIMLFMKEWAKEYDTPIPQREVIRVMGERGIKHFTTLWSLNSLIKKGFIRRGYSEKRNVTKYVMIINI